jgi:hypothetical protein
VLDIYKLGVQNGDTVVGFLGKTTQERLSTTIELSNQELIAKFAAMGPRKGPPHRPCSSSKGSFTKGIGMSVPFPKLYLTDQWWTINSQLTWPEPGTS